jgi:hypothetical protein
MLLKKRSVLSDVAAQARERDYRLTHSEIKMSVTINLDSVQKRIDETSKQFRELDSAIQSLNWTIDIP